MDINVAWLTINRICNLRCSWCYAQELIDESPNMCYDLAKNLIDILHQAGVTKIYFIGGEPTLHPELFKMLSYAKENEFESVVVTNGIALSSTDFCDRVRALQYEKLHLGISLKGISAADYIENCGRDSFHLVVRGIGNSKQYGFNYSLSYVLTTDNIDSITNFADTFNAFSFDKNITFALCNDVVLQDGEILKNSKHPLEIERVFEEKYEEINSILNGRFTLHQSFPLCQCSTNLIKKMEVRHQIYTSCHVHTRSGVIFDTDGSLLLCNHLAGFSFGQFGKDFSDYNSFKHFWNSDYAVEMHRRLTTMPSTECRDCSIQEKCGGGCCIQWFSNTFDSYVNY